MVIGWALKALRLRGTTQGLNSNFESGTTYWGRLVPKIISQPYPDEMREIGFEQAKKSDIENHKHLLTDLWDRAAGKN